MSEEPPTPLVNASRFRAAHAQEWAELEGLVRAMEGQSIRALSEDDLLRLPLLYRTTLSSLSVARETSLDRALVTYLEQLSTRAYFQIYGVPTTARSQLAAFFTGGWPRAVRALWRETLFAVTIFALAALLGYALVARDPNAYYTLMPAEMTQGRDPSSSVQALRETIYPSGHDAVRQALGAFATFLFTHNAQIAILCFALGFAFGLPTALLLLQNAISFGAFVALFVSKGLGPDIGGWLAIHGTTEIFAIILSSAAGFHIGLAAAFPGRRNRLEAMIATGATAATVMGGTVVMLAVAGILEGIGRQLITSLSLRALIGAAMLAGWLLYFYLPQGNKHGLAPTRA